MQFLLLNPKLMTVKIYWNQTADHCVQSVRIRIYPVWMREMQGRITLNMDTFYAVDHLLLPHIKHIQKIKRDLELVSLPHFLHNSFLKNKFLLLYPLTDQVPCYGSFYFLRYWAICVLQLFVNQIVTS